jgi:hypothetical protein
MVTCSGCGRPIEKVPDWLGVVKAEFICNNCPNRQTKNIAFVNFDPEPKAVAAAEEEDVDVEEVADEDIEL